MTCNPADDAPYWALTEPTMLDDVPEDVYHSGGVVTPGPQVSQSGLMTAPAVCPECHGEGDVWREGWGDDGEAPRAWLDECDVCRGTGVAPEDDE